MTGLVYISSREGLNFGGKRAKKGEVLDTSGVRPSALVNAENAGLIRALPSDLFPTSALPPGMRKHLGREGGPQRTEVGRRILGLEDKETT